MTHEIRLSLANLIGLLQGKRVTHERQVNGAGAPHGAIVYDRVVIHPPVAGVFITHDDMDSLEADDMVNLMKVIHKLDTKTES